jgi:hypothetical protein
MTSLEGILLVKNFHDNRPRPASYGQKRPVRILAVIRGAAGHSSEVKPMRPVVDRAILQLVRSTAFTGADFPIQADGVCRLNPELAWRVVQLADDGARGHV